VRLPSSHNVLKMSTIGRNAHVQTFAKVVDSFVDRYLWQVIADLLLLQCQQTRWTWHDVNSDVICSV